MHALQYFIACMKKKHTRQYTVRDISEAADLRLRETAASEDISLNQAALRALDRGLGLTGEPVRYRSLRALVTKGDKLEKNSWEKVLGEMDRINPEDWA